MTVRSKYEGPFSLPYRVKEVVSEVRQFMYLMADFLVVEHMQVYTQRQQKGDPNDLIDLSYLSGSIAQALCWSRCGLPTPKAWKGGIDKKPHHARLRTHVKNLKGRVSGHAWDAFGLALYGAEKYAYTQKR